ncbi:MAG: hypothetical protein H6707_16150 [Deltaproteobacteria bacterium]|nr:hypothetical protein [Deltaproteobacteria bacterium]
MDRRRITLLLLMVNACARPVGPMSTATARDVLRVVRPTSAEALAHRAQALQVLGRLAHAELELRLAVAQQPAYRLQLARVLCARGKSGACLKSYLAVSRARLEQSDRRQLSLLLRERVARRTAGQWIAQGRAATAEDLARVQSLDDRAPRESHRQSAVCTAPAERFALPPTAGKQPDCRRRASLAFRRLSERSILIACDAPQLAESLEQQGCASGAADVWGDLARQYPKQPQFHLGLARTDLMLGRQRRALLRLVDYLYFSPRQPSVYLDAARLLLSAGLKRQSAEQAITALALAPTANERGQAAQLLRASGFAAAAEQAVRNETLKVGPPAEQQR